MSYRPTPQDPKHEKCVNTLIEECRKRDIKITDIPQYYLLPLEHRDIYIKLFTNEALFLRSKPDKLLSYENRTPLIDCKTSNNETTGNIAIELSSFYWGLQYNILGLEFYYCYLKNNDEAILFSPKENPPHTIYLQPKWDKTEAKELFEYYAKTMVKYFSPHTIFLKTNPTGGSKDPFILKPENELKAFYLTEYLDEIRFNKPRPNHNLASFMIQTEVSS